MIKFRMSGERNAIHALTNQVRSAYPDVMIASQDCSDRLSARMDVSLSVDEAMGLFGKQLDSSLTAITGTISDRQRHWSDWRSSLRPENGRIS
ncbi:hypothetical protein SAMN02745119_01509 [Trichlorobacter thiogenes]|uniref:Uncharacterized protein n=1 Tax=Trichlorobacter thiogenes TaxID=115783 RepID=A0A1T4N3G0_9BACT|nr:hypothetical protein [Trichlorobacter thiogenes]SJZ73900.1 hypothetical protein SAMN02745119_01509 [Trichlorobacter thiogenes]